MTESKFMSLIEVAPQEGVRIALELIERMKPWASGIYLMPQFSHYDLVAEDCS